MWMPLALVPREVAARPNGGLSRKAPLCSEPPMLAPDPEPLDQLAAAGVPPNPFSPPLALPVRGYYGEGEAGEAEADRVFDEQMAEWEMLEERAADAQHGLDGLREARDARDALERARIALIDCEGCTPLRPADDEVVDGGVTGPAEATGGGAAPCLCTDGQVKTKVETTKRF